MASTVQEKDIKRLWEAGYLAKKIDHCLPPMGQIVPTPDGTFLGVEGKLGDKDM